MRHMFLAQDHNYGVLLVEGFLDAPQARLRNPSDWCLTGLSLRHFESGNSRSLD